MSSGTGWRMISLKNFSLSSFASVFPHAMDSRDSPVSASTTPPRRGGVYICRTRLTTAPDSSRTITFSPWSSVAERRNT